MVRSNHHGNHDAGPRRRPAPRHDLSAVATVRFNRYRNGNSCRRRQKTALRFMNVFQLYGNKNRTLRFLPITALYALASHSTTACAGRGVRKSTAAKCCGRFPPMRGEPFGNLPPHGAEVGSTACAGTGRSSTATFCRGRFPCMRGEKARSAPSLRASRLVPPHARG